MSPLDDFGAGSASAAAAAASTPSPSPALGGLRVQILTNHSAGGFARTPAPTPRSPPQVVGGAGYVASSATAAYAALDPMNE